MRRSLLVGTAVFVLALGAAGVWMGSAWLVTSEYGSLSPLPGLREALLRATSSDTIRSRIYSGKPARLLKNSWTDAWHAPGAPEALPMPLQNLLVSEAHQRLMRSGQPDVVPMQVGQIVGRMNEVRPVAEVIATLPTEADDTPARLGRPGSRGQSTAPVASCTAPADQSTCEVGSAACSVGGTASCRIAITILITPATPAAAWVCPMFDFTDPSHNGRPFARPCP